MNKNKLHNHVSGFNWYTFFWFQFQTFKLSILIHYRRHNIGISHETLINVGKRVSLMHSLIRISPVPNLIICSNLWSVFIFHLERISSGAFLCSLDAALYKLIVDWLMNVSSWPGSTHLTHVEHDRLVSSFYSFIHCGTQVLTTTNYSLPNIGM